ncbi:MAG: hypothetical protein HGA62_09470 [Chlorobiaceae bacterium]|nr:hypothetical protein [Chlorobiaceae bacterium]NTV60929.1 hypothetical protein [Chlorobiaceae bacterium]
MNVHKGSSWFGQWSFSNQEPLRGAPHETVKDELTEYIGTLPRLLFHIRISGNDFLVSR